MKNKLLFLATLAILCMSSQCEKEKVSTEKANLGELQITLDQTAWFCAGQCRFNFYFEEASITTKRYDAPNDENPIWECTRTLSSQNWDDILKVLDLDALAKTEATIGCPGCADSPIETLTVVNGEFSHEVRMNVLETVNSIQPLLDELRAQVEEYRSQENCQ